MILAYIDDSGNEDQEVMSFAGYLARWEDWRAISKRWRKVLKKYGVTDFHPEFPFYLSAHSIS